MLKLILKFFMSDVLAKGIAVILLPIYSIIMGPSQLGQFSEWFSTYNVIVALVAFGIPSYVLVMFDPQKNNGHILSAQFFNFFKKWLLFIVPLGLFFLIFFKNIFFGISIMIASVSFSYITYLEAILRAEKKTKSYLWLELSLTFMTSVLPLFFVIISSTSTSRILGYSIGLLFLVFVLIIFFVPKIPKISINTHFAKKTVAFGFPVVLITGINWLKLYVDIQLLKNLDDYHYSGILFFAFQIVSIVNIIAASLNRASTVTFYELIRTNKMGLFNQIIFKIMLVLIGITSGIILIFYFGINQFIPAFSEVIYLLCPMSVGILLYTLGQFVASFFMFYEKTYMLTLAILASSLIHPLVSFYIVHYLEWQYIGYSYLISSILFLLFILLLKSNFKITIIASEVN